MLNSFEVIYIFDYHADIDSINIALISTAIPRIIFFIVVGIKSAGCLNFAIYLTLFDPITFPMSLAAYSYVTFLVNIFYL